MTVINIKKLSSLESSFQADLKALLAFETAQDDKIDEVVAGILKDVKKRGDDAVIDYTNRFDKTNVNNVKQLTLTQHDLMQALNALPIAQRSALETAAERVRNYHQKQLMESWHYTETDGTLLGQQVTALDRVGLYVPGGKAAYPSSVLMNAIPAKVAGVKDLIMVVPTPNGEKNDLVLAAAAIAGVDQVFCIGGAQAVGALAYGTQSIPQVDKIVGPGNAYVAAAKRRVFGVVGIDMVAGPSEILVICDGLTNPDWIAMDLFSQAEHDELAQSILISPDAEFLDKVQASINKLIDNMPRKEIIATSLQSRGALIQVKDMDEAAEISNYIAPEHLELSMDDALLFSKKIKHAGAIFMGRNTCEALGDYCAGPNHVLPTSRTARFSSPLGVYDFQKRSSLIFVSPEGAQTLGKVAAELAYGEGLQAHAQSAEYRLKS
jgi:histidinol dehydrogenase